MTRIRIDPARLPVESRELRQEVRDFLQREADRGVFVPNEPTHPATDPTRFARDCGAAGWIGMTWPRQYGGQERSFLDRYVVTEEMLAAEAPTGRFFTADRQSGPLLIKYGSERLKSMLLPGIVAGELSFCIGMSEANSGSDLFAAQARATPVAEGWMLNGAKLWTSSAHFSDYMIGLFRTALATAENRRHGLTQFVIPMGLPGITVNPIMHMSGEHRFNEVVFDDVVVPHDHVLGSVDDAWKQATAELVYERSGPERFLAHFHLLPALIDHLGADLGLREAEGIGRLTAQLHTIRRMSIAVNSMIAAGEEPTVEGSLVKELGTLWQQSLAERARELSGPRADRVVERTEDALFRRRLDAALVTAPQITIQGGTTEVLRGIIARGLGLR